MVNGIIQHRGKETLMAIKCFYMQNQVINSQHIYCVKSIKPYFIHGQGQWFFCAPKTRKLA